jgi:anti-sigma B factor antagonist
MGREGCCCLRPPAYGGIVRLIGHTIWVTVQPIRWSPGLEELRFSMESHGASVVASVRGELDIVSSQRFDDCLAEAAAISDRVILDLSAVDFMDTTALAVIVGHWRRQVEVGGLFFLAGARYRYIKALWITGLADRLPMYDTVDEALAAARTVPPEPGAEAASGHDARKSDEPGATAG